VIFLQRPRIEGSNFRLRAGIDRRTVSYGRGTSTKGDDMSNVDTARAAYEAFSRGDMEALSEMLAEDGTWLTSDELPLGGETHGRDTILGNFAQIPNYWSSFSVEPEEFIDAGEWVVIRGTQRAGNDAGSFEAPFAHLMKFEDGKIVRGEFYADSAKAAKVLA
jgi:ketosteroid isomerase-like protein